MVYPKGKVEDGTRCRLDPKNKDVCIKGKCRVSKVLVRFSSTTAARAGPPDVLEWEAIGVDSLALCEFLSLPKAYEGKTLV